MLEGLGETGEPGAVSAGQRRRQQAQDEGHGGEADPVLGVHQQHDGHDQGGRADDHERLADHEPVRDPAEDQQPDDVHAPVDLLEPVEAVQREAQELRQVEHEVGDGREVDDQEEVDRDRAEDRVDVQHLPPAVLAEIVEIKSPGPGLDQDVLVQGGHPLAAQAGRQLAQQEQADHEHDDGGVAGEPVQLLPVGEGDHLRQVRVGHDAEDEEARHRPEGPEPHGQPALELGGEVTDQGRCAHEDRAVGQVQQAGEHRVPRLAGRVRDRPQREHRVDGQADHDHVGPAPLVAEAGDVRGQPAADAGDDQQVGVVVQRHPPVREDDRRRRVARVHRPGEDDVGQHHDGEQEDPVAAGGVAAEIAVPEAPDTGPHRLPGCRCRSGSAHGFLLARQCAGFPHHRPRRKL